jgi:hypothetical protein
VSRVLALPALVAAIAAPARAQESVRAHMEGCLVWNAEGNVAVRNDCSRPLTLWLMNFADEQVVTADIAPGGRFTSAFAWGQSGGFMFTACPVGYRPSLRFAIENKEPIGVSLYNCVAGRPTS